MRDRLIDLIKDLAEDLVANCDEECDTCKHGDCVGKVVDHLLANGVIVPPVKVGDTVYSIVASKVHSFVVVSSEMRIFAGGIDDSYNANGELCPIRFCAENIGKTVFLTKEEAEQAIARVKGG